MGEIQHLENLNITLTWSDWSDWKSATGSKVPVESGVYEAKCKGEEKRLHIGETTTSLKQRIDDFRGGLKSGSSAHTTGKRIYDHYNGNAPEIIVRWAVTNCYDAKLAEAWLHRLHRNDFDGSMPTHDQDPCHRD